MNTHNRLVPVPTWTRAVKASRVPAYRVGEPFERGRGRWPAGAQYAYGNSGHELTLFVPSPAPEMVAGLRHGEVGFALSVAGPVFYLAYCLDGSSGWGDVPYCWHLQHPGARAIPPAATSPESRALLWMSLVGADDGLIHAQRGVTLCPEFTRELHRAIRAQAAASFDPLECALAIAEASRERPNAACRLDAAHAWSVGNA